MVSENLRFREMKFGRDAQLVTSIDEFRAEQYTSAILSGTANYVSGQAVFTVTASNVVRVRPVAVAIHNRETNPMTLVIRDGGITGNIIGGPWTVTALSDVTKTRDWLRGSFALSGFYFVVISGTFAAGMEVRVGYVQEADPTAVGGMIE